MLPLETVKAKGGRGRGDEVNDNSLDSAPPATPIPVTPFQQPLFIPKCAQAGTLKNDLDWPPSPAPGDYPGTRFEMPGECVLVGRVLVGPLSPEGAITTYVTASLLNLIWITKRIATIGTHFPTIRM